MKTIHVITSLGAGGAEAMLHKLLEARPGTARDVVVVSLTDVGPTGARIQALGIPVFALMMTPGRPSPAGVARLIRLLRRERPQLVQTWMYHADLLGGLAARALGIPVIWGVRHGDLKPGDNPLTRLTRRICAQLSWSVPKAIVCCSESSIRIHVRAGYAPERFVYIPNGFDLARFRPDPGARAALRQELGIPLDSPTVGLVARFHPHKDHATFLSAASMILRQRSSAHFVLCGEGADWGNTELAGLIDRGGVRPAFHLLGRRDHLESVYPAFDVAGLSSVTESFPNVIGEAMACGIPCVATDCGDVREVIGTTGRVVPVRDPAALAGAILEMLALDRGAVEELGAAARSRVTGTYDIEAVANRFAKLQTEVVASAAP
jgi:glycosyltransferase involved in cell wall biosynthesis